MTIIQSLSAIKISLRGKALQKPILRLFDCKNEAFAIIARNLLFDWSTFQVTFTIGS